jgi:hypothetical protein
MQIADYPSRDADGKRVAAAIGENFSEFNQILI